MALYALGDLHLSLNSNKSMEIFGDGWQDYVLRLKEAFSALRPEDVTVLGELDFLYLRSECLMHPVLARVDAAALGHMRRSPAEVRDTFLVPIDWLRTHPPEVYRYRLDPVGIESFPYDAAGVPADYRWQCAQMEVPVYRGLPHPLWGLTARITDWLVQRFYAEPTP